MKLVLTRENYANYVEYYRYHFTESELSDLIEYIKEKFIPQNENDTLPEITFDVIAAIYNRDYDKLPDAFTEPRNFKSWRNESYQTSLDDFIWDILNERVWDCYEENEYLDSNEWEDDIEYEED